ncbi:MAG: branched-chain amino acid ABC transporter substrate-binding protein [Pseudomonadota bacterium]
MKHITRPLALVAPLAVPLALGIALAGCGKEPQQDAAATDSTVVKIGQASPLTGQQALIGKDNENGVRMAIEELNAGQFTIAGKVVTFELDSQDDQADPRLATTVAQRFVDNKVNAVIGHLNSGASIPASKVYADAGLVQVSPSATAIKYTAQGYKTAFRVMANDAQQGKALGDYAVHDLNVKKVAIVDDRTAYGQGLADEFEKYVAANGATVVAREYTTDKSTEFSAILTKIKGTKPELVFFGGMAPQAGPMVKQMRSLGLKAQFLGGDGTRADEFRTLAGADAEGTIASLPGVPFEKMPGGPAFTKTFTEKYGQIQMYAPYAYDAMKVVALAMQKAGSTDPAKYLPALAGIEYPGVTGTIRFDEKGDIVSGAVTLYRVTNGEWVTVKTIGGEAEVAAAPATAPAAGATP